MTNNLIKEDEDSKDTASPKWIKPEDFDSLKDSCVLEPFARALLFGEEGLLTSAISTLYAGEPVLVELASVSEGELKLPFATDEEVAYLGREGQALRRKIYMSVGDQRLVFAHTLLSKDYTSEEVFNSLKGRPDADEECDTLGKVLMREGAEFKRVSLELAMIRSKDVASELGLAADTLFYVRRFKVLKCDAEGEWIISASVVEFFSPVLIDKASNNDIQLG
jgi:hypothetical protein